MTLEQDVDPQAPDESGSHRTISKRRADQCAGAILVLFGSIVLSQALKNRAGISERLDPRTVPLALSLTLVVAGIALVVAASRYGDDAGDIEWPDMRGGSRVAISVVAFVAYTQALTWVGMAVATGIFVAVVEWFLDRGSVIRAVGWGFLSGIVASLVFIALLTVQLPVGPVDDIIASLIGR